MSTLLRATLPPSAEGQPLPAPDDALPSPHRASEPNGPFSPLTNASVMFADETLIADARGQVTPSQFVERKLISLLKGKVIPVSQIQLMGPHRRRG